jgi:hypothetical protein
MNPPQPLFTLDWKMWGLVAALLAVVLLAVVLRWTAA